MALKNRHVADTIQKIQARLEKFRVGYSAGSDHIQPDAEVFESVSKFVDALDGFEKLTEPRISITPVGSIGLTWLGDNGRMYVEFKNGGHGLAYSLLRADGAEDYGAKGSQAIEILKNFVR